MTITIRTRHTFRSVSIGRITRRPGKLVRRASMAEGQCVTAPGVLYVALYGAWHAAGSRLTINGRDFGRRVIPSRVQVSV